ncbi:C40 family peptidase [Phytopseudomonas flavescens]|uniref:C40 family peptidase n=1 Tax=Phytopseudomonas flavescens TaxID=29435 RepID=UPI000A0297F6|nr:C40 family peptidase [Pseudomonas flavescens]
MNKLILSLFLGGTLLCAAAGNASASFRVHLQDGSSQVVAPAHVEQSPAQDVVKRALGALGTPYRWGGTSLERGFDCSGLVNYAFRKVDDLDLPRTSRALSRVDGPKVAKGKLEPGDLLFFRIRGRSVDHVAIYLGNDRFIHAPRRGSSVRIDKLSDGYWKKHFQLARRVMPEGTQLASNG